MKRLVVVGLLVGSLALGLAACGGASSEKTGGDMKMDKPLFERLGGQPAINAVVHDFLGFVAGDARINARFANANLPHLEQMLDEQVCAATGGGCQYTGKSMEEAHAGMHITDDEFNALVEDLVKSLDAHKVPDKEKGELLGALGGLKPKIVNL